jgi:hypothetical protein
MAPRKLVTLLGSLLLALASAGRADAGGIPEGLRPSSPAMSRGHLARRVAVLGAGGLLAGFATVRIAHLAVNIQPPPAPTVIDRLRMRGILRQ